MSDTLRHVRDTNAPPPPHPLSAPQILAWLNYALDGLMARRAEIIEALQETARRCPRIDDDETQGQVTENIKMAAALRKVAEDRRAEEKRPFRDGGTAVDAWFKRFQEPLDKALAPVHAAAQDYAIRKASEARRAAEAARQQADAAARIAAAEAAAAMERNAPHAEAAVEAWSEMASAAAKAAELVTAKPAHHSRTRGMYGAVASLRTTWHFEVSDFAAVPREYLCLDETRIKAAMQARDPSGKPVAVIPGITWTATTALGVR